jgi:hypothetical protein
MLVRIHKACGDDETIWGGGLVRILRVLRFLRIRKNYVDKIGRG